MAQTETPTETIARLTAAVADHTRRLAEWTDRGPEHTARQTIILNLVKLHLELATAYGALVPEEAAFVNRMKTIL